MSWLETYRGAVNRWEVDNVDHFTVAFYFARFEDATLAVLTAVGLDPVSLAGTGRAAAPVECLVTYHRELRVADILHIQSGIASSGADHLEIAHQVFDSGDGTLCTTALQRVAVFDGADSEPVSLAPAQPRAVQALAVEWAGDAKTGSARQPQSDAGFIDTARDVIRPAEVDVLGRAALSALIHRFSAANGQIVAAFGMTPAYMRDERRGFSTFEFKLHIQGALQAGEQVAVRTGLLHVGNSSLRLFHRMTNGRTGQLVATLEQAGVHLDLVARRPAPLPPELRDRAKAMLVSDVR
jgi:acyl-CoA thioesterase FadM